MRKAFDSTLGPSATYGHGSNEQRIFWDPYAGFMPELIVKLGDSVVERHLVEKDIISIGRAKDNDIVIENLSVSRNHARIRRQGNTYVLTDLNSANGTFVNNVRITKTEILDGDVITIGKHHIVFVNKDLSESDVLVEALAAERTMVIERADRIGVLCFTEGKMRGKTYPLTKAETSIGKSPQCDIVISDDWFLAKKQAIIARRGSEYEIRDLGTLRRTRINGKPLTGSQKLNEGDTIEVGSERILFKLADAHQFETPAGRVPKELGLEDSIFASVSELPPELEPLRESDVSPPGSASAKAMDENEDWSQVAEGLDSEAAAPAPPAISVEDLHPVPGDFVTQSFGQTDVEAASSAVQQEEVGQPSEPVAEAPIAESKSVRLSRRKQRELQRAAKQPVAADVPATAEKKAEAPEVESSGWERAEAAVSPSEPKAAEALEAAVAGGEGELPAKTEPPTSGILSVEEQIAMWEAALQNKSPVIRRQAAKMLKKLTGKDYAY
ncbi:MAG: FHA domain-containing protein [Candidatus Sumerlaeaceae bacterium]|nr:FHA domain-containing protein [Candidatus Sumerlaeaceae bacterium]